LHFNPVPILTQPESWAQSQTDPTNWRSL